MFKILDASAFINLRGNQLNPLSQYITTLRVIEELKDLTSQLTLQNVQAMNQIEIISLDVNNVKKYIQNWKIQGIGWKLSFTDAELIVLALKMKEKGRVQLFSDDYEIQNTAKQLGIHVSSVIRREARIKHHRKRFCLACGAKVPIDASCPECGHDKFKLRGRKNLRPKKH